MNMKNLIAQMDAIETGKKYIAESAELIVEYKGGTDAEKIKNWQKHIDQFKEKGMYKAADDATKAAKTAQPGFGKTNKSAKEGMGSIARALMQDMGLDDQAIDEVGQPPADWNTERDGVWMGDNPAMAPAVDSSGQPIQAGSGGNVMSLGGGKQGDQKPAQAAPIRTGVEIPANTIKNNPGFYPQTGAGEFGTDPQTSFNMPDDSQMGPTTTGDQKPAPAPAPTGGQNSPLGPAADQQALNRARSSAAGSKEQIASIMNMQRELGVTPDGKIGPKTRDAMARKPEIAAKYADELGGAKQYNGVPKVTTGGQKAAAWDAANAGSHAQGFNSKSDGAGPPTQVDTTYLDPNVPRSYPAAAPAAAAGQNVVSGKTGPNGEPIQTSQGREGYFDAKTRKWTFVKEGRVSIPEDDRILNMIRGIKV